MSEVTQRNKEEAKEIAAKLGLVAVLPRKNELFLDLDMKPSKTAARVEEVLHDNGVYFVSKLITKSKSGKRHLYIKLSRNVAASTRIALQACLGSDPVREVLSILRKLEGSEAPTALFETKKELKRVKAWRVENMMAASTAKAILDDDVPF